SAVLSGPDGSGPRAVGAGYAELSWSWRPGEAAVLELELAVRVTEPDPRVGGAAAPELSGSWRPGEAAVLELELPVRVTEPDPRVDAVRGCVAVERGP